MYVTSVERVREYDVNLEGACKVKVKYLLHKGVGAKRLQLRLITVNVGGYTPLEKHAHEHEVFIEHQFKNIGDEPVEFLCTKETHEARST